MSVATRQSAFIYAAGESIAEMVFPVVLTTARWGVLATSDEARQTYRWVSQMTVALGQLAFWSTVWAWTKVQRWADAEVQSCLYIEDYEIDYQADYGIPDDIWNSDPDHIADAGKKVEADPFSPTVNEHYPAVPAAMAPVATLVVPVTKAQPLTSAELRRQCQSAGIKWRNAHGKGRHLSKGEMIAALQEMDCWALSEGCLA